MDVESPFSLEENQTSFSVKKKYVLQFSQKQPLALSLQEKRACFSLATCQCIGMKTFLKKHFSTINFRIMVK